MDDGGGLNASTWEVPPGGWEEERSGVWGCRVCVCVCVGGGGGYHWRELPQVSSFVVTNMFVATNTCLSRRNISFAATKVCSSRQAYFCRDKRHVLSRQKNPFLSRQNYVCHDKKFAITKICGVKHNFVATKVSSRQAYFCCDKSRVLSRQFKKQQLLAAPTNDGVCVCGGGGGL